MKSLGSRFVAIGSGTVFVITFTLIPAAASSRRASLARKVPAAEWVSSACSALSTWYADTGDFDDAMDAVMDRLNGDRSTKPAQARAQLVRSAEKAVKVSEAHIAAMQQAGTPDVVDGESVAKAYLGTLTDLRDVYDRGRKSFAKMKGDIDAAAVTAINALDDIERGWGKIGDPLDQLRQEEALSAAIDAEPACADLIAETNLSIGTCLFSDDLSSVVTCNGPHAYEVYAMPDLTDRDAITASRGGSVGADLIGDAGPGAEYPGKFVLGTVADWLCGAEFEAFVGVSWDVSEFDYANVAPSGAQWGNGARRALCVLYRDDSQMMLGSAEGAGS